ncbi:MAG: hypothetical protein N4A38_02000 [Candidatus Gracilibacteria bacterium]|nr:hypothetical protein [Candidatus Gracilibacteria bacterium]
MIKKTLKKFSDLSTDTKSILIIGVLINISEMIQQIYINIFIFKTSSLEFLIIFNMLYFTAIFLAYNIAGFIAAKLRINLKYYFYSLIISTLIGLIVAFIIGGNVGYYAFILINAIGTGFFRVANNTYVLNKLKEDELDFYGSTKISLLGILKIIVPLLAGVLFLSIPIEVINPFYIVILLGPIFFLGAIPSIKKVSGYQLKKSDFQFKYFVDFFRLSDIYSLVYQFFFRSPDARGVVTYVLAIIILKNEVNLSGFEALLGAISILFTFMLGHKQNPKNRQKLIFVFAFLLLALHIILGLNVNLLGYTIFALGMIVVYPMFQVAITPFNITIMKPVQGKINDFMLTIIRDLLYYTSRIFFLTVLYFMFKGHENNTEALSIAIIFLGFTPIILSSCIMLSNKLNNKNN